MSAAILDGRAKFGKRLEDFYRDPDIAAMLARRGLLSLPTETATEASPALARVNPLNGAARWIADCPDCRSAAEYVWLDDPRFLCCRCANRLIGHRWRPVKVPGNRKRIEALLLARPDPETRGWSPGETTAALRTQNAQLGIGG